MNNEYVLLEACSLGNLVAVQQLLLGGVDPNCRHKMNGWTPLHWAVYRQHAPVVSHLLRSQADPRIQNADGKSALDFCNTESIRQVFVENGFMAANAMTSNEMNGVNNNGQSSFEPNYLKCPDITPELKMVEQQQIPLVSQATAISRSQSFASMTAASEGEGRKRRNTDPIETEAPVENKPLSTLLVVCNGQPLGTVSIDPQSTVEQLKQTIVQEVDGCDNIDSFQLGKQFQQVTVPINQKQMVKSISEIFNGSDLTVIIIPNN